MVYINVIYVYMVYISVSACKTCNLYIKTCFQELSAMFDEHFGISHAEMPAPLDADDLEPEPSDTLQLHLHVREHTLAYVRSEVAEANSGACLDPYLSEDKEREQLEQVHLKGCSCKKNCLQSFDIDDVYQQILSLREMSKDEKEMYVMGSLNRAGADQNESRYGARKRVRYVYKFQGSSVCQEAFEVVFDIKHRVLENLISHIHKNGVVPRIHGNAGRSPHNSLKLENIKPAVDFILNYSDDYGLPQPAAPRGRDDDPPIYLPASTKKLAVYELYRQGCESMEPTPRILGNSSFKDIWAKCCPRIKISNPQDDVCRTCKTARNLVSSARTEDDKLAATSAYHDHLIAVKREREEYKKWIHNSALGDEQHYTFDYSQMVTIPRHSRQIGQLYFVSGRKVQIFGVRIDGIPQQLNYLIDEDQSIGKTLYI
jgi:hypothetical protein